MIRVTELFNPSIHILVDLYHQDWPSRISHLAGKAPGFCTISQCFPRHTGRLLLQKWYWDSYLSHDFLTGSTTGMTPYYHISGRADIFFLLVLWPHAHYGWTKLKPAARNPLMTSHMGSKHKFPNNHLLPSGMYIIRKLELGRTFLTERQIYR